MNEIIQTLAEQINARELKFAKFQLLADEERNTITVRKGVKFLEIHYNEALDFYETTKGKIKKFKVFRDETLNYVYFDQLKPIIEEYFKFEYVMDQFIRVKN